MSIRRKRKKGSSKVVDAGIDSVLFVGDLLELLVYVAGAFVKED